MSDFSVFGRIVDDSVLGLGYGFLFVPGEKHELVEVVLESVLVQFQRFLASVLSPVIDGDSDRSGELLSESCGFDFGQSESYIYYYAYLFRFWVYGCI